MEEESNVVEEKYLGIAKRNWVMATLILGIVSVIFAWFGYGAVIGLVAGIFGVLFAKKCKDAGIEDGKKTAGLVLSVIGIIGGAFVFISCIACTGCIGCAALVSGA